MKEPENRIEQYRSGKEGLLAATVRRLGKRDRPRVPEERLKGNNQPIWKTAGDQEHLKETEGQEHLKGTEGQEHLKEIEGQEHLKEIEGQEHLKETESQEHLKETEGQEHLQKAENQEPWKEAKGQEQRLKEIEGHRTETVWIMTATCPAVNLSAPGEEKSGFGV